MGKDLTKVDHTVFVCMGGTCKKAGSEENMRELRCAIKMAGLHEVTHTVKTLCLGQCENAPVMFIQPDNTWYKRMTADVIGPLVSGKLARRIDLLDNILYQDGWQQMQPARIIEPKTHNALSVHEDSFAGLVDGASIYAWEHNVYPLLKEIFLVHRSSLVIHHHDTVLQSARFTVTYAGGLATITGNVEGESLQVVLSAGKESEFFLKKVSRVKLYRRQDSDVCGLYLASAHDRVFLHAEWSANEDLWDHLLDNYVSISG